MRLLPDYVRRFASSSTPLIGHNARRSKLVPESQGSLQPMSGPSLLADKVYVTRDVRKTPYGLTSKSAEHNRPETLGSHSLSSTDGQRIKGLAPLIQLHQTHPFFLRLKLLWKEKENGRFSAKSA